MIQPGLFVSSISLDPKTALPFRSCAPAGLRRTFAVQLRVLARILCHDEETSIRARYAEQNLLIVPFFLNSPDFRCTDIVVSYLNLLKWALFGKRGSIYKREGTGQGGTPRGVFLRRDKLQQGETGVKPGAGDRMQGP
jgi:hypothetical protein